MKALSVLCIAVSLPGTIIAAALYPTIRDNQTVAGVLIAIVGLGAVAVGLALANAIENGVNAWGSARNIQAAAGGAPPPSDYIDVQHRIAQTRLTDARAAQIGASAMPALPPWGGQVESVAQWDEHVSGGGWGR